MVKTSCKYYNNKTGNCTNKHGKRRFLFFSLPTKCCQKEGIDENGNKYKVICGILEIDNHGKKTDINRG